MTDKLKEKILSIPELRLALAEFSKEGISEITLYDFLTYLAGLMKDAKTDTTNTYTHLGKTKVGATRHKSRGA